MCKHTQACPFTVTQPLTKERVILKQVSRAGRQLTGGLQIFLFSICNWFSAWEKNGWRQKPAKEFLANSNHAGNPTKPGPPRLSSAGHQLTLSPEQVQIAVCLDLQGLNIPVGHPLLQVIMRSRIKENPCGISLGTT